MKTDPNGPADTRNMGVVHSAMRRDLKRLRVALQSDPDAARRQALADHVDWMMNFLHEHHGHEDSGLYPLVRQRNRALDELLNAMDAEHKRVNPAVEALQKAAAGYRADGIPGPLLSALDRLESVLLPHLEHEEREMMPLVSQTISHQDWLNWEDSFLSLMTKKELADQGHWLLDGVDPDTYAYFAKILPPIPRFIVLRFMGGPYQRKRTALWAGTGAESIPSQPLPA